MSKEPEKYFDGRRIDPRWISWAEAEIERGRELLVKTVIGLDLATGHGDDIDSLCTELRTEVELLRSEYSAEIERLKGAYWPGLREEFFAECTEQDSMGFSKINITPHNLFQWFEKKLKFKSQSYLKEGE